VLSKLACTVRENSSLITIVKNCTHSTLLDSLLAVELAGDSSYTHSIERSDQQGCLNITFLCGPTFST
jgi:hypothetical protein